MKFDKRSIRYQCEAVNLYLQIEIYSEILSICKYYRAVDNFIFDFYFLKRTSTKYIFDFVEMTIY